MPPSLSELEQPKRVLLAAFSQLTDLRPGSVSAVGRFEDYRVERRHTAYHPSLCRAPIRHRRDRSLSPRN